MLRNEDHFGLKASQALVPCSWANAVVPFHTALIVSNLLIAPRFNPSAFGWESAFK